MKAKLECACGNTMALTGREGEEEYEIQVEGGRVERKGGKLLVICGKCGREAGRVDFARQVGEK